MEYITNFYLNHILTIIFFLPLLAVIMISFSPDDEPYCRRLSLIFSGTILLNILIVTVMKFNPFNTAIQNIECYKWFGDVIKLKLGLDGLGLSMILLTGILLPVTIVASEPIASNKPKLYYSMLMLAIASLMGVFLSQDLFFFFLSWELELIPMYFLIAIWGGKNRAYASLKFLIYTFIAGICMLAGTVILFLASHTNTFDMQVLMKASQGIPYSLQMISFILFFICFIIKLPSFPVHTWLPDAHVEAPTPISMLLAGILLKMGGYGLYKICAGFFPNVLADLGIMILVLATVNIVGGAVACLVQNDMKRVIAYSSISHMGFVLLGLISLTEAGFSGGIFQMFSHGLISAALFMLVGTLYERTHTRAIADYGGMAKYMPKCFYLFILASMANLALPALSGFVGESLVFYGAFSSQFFTHFPTAFHFNFGQICVLFSSISVILTASYMLWLLKRVFMGEPNPKWGNLTDLRRPELIVLGSLLFFVTLYGIYPNALSKLYEPTSTKMVQNCLSAKY